MKKSILLLVTGILIVMLAMTGCTAKKEEALSPSTPSPSEQSAIESSAAAPGAPASSADATVGSPSVQTPEAPLKPSTPAAPSTTTPAKETTPSNQTAPANQQSLFGNEAAKADQDLTVQDMLIYAIQDEYLARGEYDYINNTFGDPRPFSNIIRAEVGHIDSLKTLLNTYQIAVPEDKASSYLIHPKDIAGAMDTGVLAEVNNIAMYDRFLTQPNLPQDVKDVFIRLRDASKNHLASFERGPRPQ